MRANSTFSPDEDMQEITLRATLHEHAPTDVDVDHAWMIVSSRCQATNRLSTAHSPLPMLLMWLPGKHSHPVSLKTRVVMGSLTLAVILFVGINMLFPLLPGSGSAVDAHQYQQIGQSQSSSGLTIIADKGYAYDDHLAITYTIQPSADLKENLANAVLHPLYTVKDQNDQNTQTPSWMVGCGFPSHYGWPLKCTVELGISHPATNAKKWIIDWDVTSVTLHYIDESALNRWLPDKVLNGNWHFHIALDIRPGKDIPVGLPMVTPSPTQSHK